MEESSDSVKIFQILIIVLVIIIIGTLGYYFIEKGWSLFDSFYMTVITIATVGYGETHELSTSGRIFTVILIFIGIGVVALSASQLAALVINREIKNILGKEKLQKQLNKLQNHYIICGLSNITRGICDTLCIMGFPFVIIENDSSKIDLITEKDKYLFVKDNPTNDSTLVKCGVKRAKGLIVCTESDADNLFISLAGKEFNPQIEIVALGSDPKIEDRMTRAGVNKVVYPLKLGGGQVAEEIFRHLGKKGHGSGKNEGALYGFYLEYYSHFEEEASTVREVIDKFSAVSVLSLKTAGKEVIDNPSLELIVHQNDSLILVMNEKKINANGRKPLHILKWSSSMSVGIVTIDKEHKHLVDLINKIDTSIERDETRSAINQVFDEMFEYVLSHFNHEEEIFEKYGYPGIAEHKKIHKELINQVKELDSQKAFIKPESIASFLRLWIKKHIMEEDKKYTEYLVSKGAD